MGLFRSRSPPLFAVRDPVSSATHQSVQIRRGTHTAGGVSAERNHFVNQSINSPAARVPIPSPSAEQAYRIISNLFYYHQPWRKPNPRRWPWRRSWRAAESSGRTLANRPATACICSIRTRCKRPVSRRAVVSIDCCLNRRLLRQRRVVVERRHDEDGARRRPVSPASTADGKSPVDQSSQLHYTRTYVKAAYCNISLLPAVPIATIRVLVLTDCC